MPAYQQINEKMIEVKLNNEEIFAKKGAMISYQGEVNFERSFLGNEGVTSLAMRAATNEGYALMEARGNLIMLEVTPNTPLRVDPDAFVGFKGDVRQEFVFDVNWRTMVGQSSGESYQHKFTGNGVVYIQPSER